MRLITQCKHAYVFDFDSCDMTWCLEEGGMVGVYSEFVRRHKRGSKCSFMCVYVLMCMYSILHLQCHFYSQISIDDLDL